MQLSSRWTVLALSAALILTSFAWADAELAVQGTYSSDTDQQELVRDAIDAAVADMNMIKRPIARNRLSKINPVYQRIRVERTASAFEVQFDDRKPIQMPLNGSAVQWEREDGEKFDVSASVHPDGTFVQTFKAEDGTRVNTFKWDEAAQKLHLNVVVISSKLPKPLEYKLVYARAAASG
jgi:hypothetical protein